MDEHEAGEEDNRHLNYISRKQEEMAQMVNRADGINVATMNCITCDYGNNARQRKSNLSHVKFSYNTSCKGIP